MRLLIYLPALAATSALAAPAEPRLNLKSLTHPADALNSLSAYFNLMASKVGSAHPMGVAPTCDLSQVSMPTAPDAAALPPPSEGLSVHHVAAGRGTQNYTCDTTSPSSAPESAGAVAVLFNVSCVAALYPDLLASIPGMLVHFDLTGSVLDITSSSTQKLGPAALDVSGHHYFRNETTPYFDLDTKQGDFGEAPCAKNSTADPPSTAAVGMEGDKAVAWLKLTTIEGATDSIQEVYRVTTAGGSAPATCEGMPATFEVQYSALYYFWSGDVMTSTKP